MSSISTRQWLTTLATLIVAYTYFSYQSGRGSWWLWPRKVRHSKWSDPNRGPAILGIYIDQLDRVVISQAVGKLDTRVILKGSLSMILDGDSVIVEPLGSSSPQSVRFWDRLDDGRTAKTVFSSLAKALEVQEVRKSRLVALVTPSLELIPAQKNLEQIALETGLAESIVFQDLHGSVLHALDVPFQRVGLVSKVAVITPDGTYVTASPTSDIGNTRFYRKPFSIEDMLRDQTDPPSNYNQLFFVHSDVGHRDYEKEWPKTSNEAVDPRSPVILHTTFESIASGAASLVGRELDIMLFNTYVRMGEPISIVIGSRGGGQDEPSRHTLMEADDKQGILVFPRGMLPLQGSRLEVVVTRGLEGDEQLGMITFDLEKLSAGSEPRIVITGSASWQPDSSVLLTTQVVDLVSAIRVSQSYRLA